MIAACGRRRNFKGPGHDVGEPGPFCVSGNSWQSSLVMETTTLLEWLAARYPTAKRTTLRRMVQAGRVTINGRRAKAASIAIAANDTIAVSDQPPSRPQKSNAAGALNVVYEDHDLLVVNKPPG